ncbi:MAG: flagellar motor protein MotB [Verrucomicrobia bacterium]|nr:flagellar motor protein MotB [Verrucomicrobiota bacterium]
MSAKGGHSGGSWKVAYADFVTAMMALFLVLWLTSQDQKIRDAVERAFNHPYTVLTDRGLGVMPGQNPENQKRPDSRRDATAKAELDLLRQINQDLLQSLSIENQDELRPTIRLELLPDGLRVSVFDRARRAIFQTETAELTHYGKWVLSTLAWTVSRYPSFKIEVEGHTEQKAPPTPAAVDRWQLTSDRANAARRMLVEQGVFNAQIRRVVGYADTIPLPDADPTDEANRRVTIMLKLDPTKYL